MMHHRLSLLWLWIRSYFKHPAENIRQARPIVPGRVYTNFGNVCKAVPYTSDEKNFITEASKVAILYQGVDPEGLLESVRSIKGDPERAKMLQRMASADTPPQCELCDFHSHGIPCPIYNILKDGSTVCDSYKYIIIKKAPQAL